MAPPKKTKNLFPDAWVIGPAAAELARNDEGVLLADDPRAAELAKAADDAAERVGDEGSDPNGDLAGEAGTDPDIDPHSHSGVDQYAGQAPETSRAVSRSDEIAELKRENERLQQLIAASRGRAEHRVERPDDLDPDIDASQAAATQAFGPADALYGGDRPEINARRSAGAQIGWILGIVLFSVVIAAAGAAWLVGGRLAGQDATAAQRLQALGSEVVRVAGRLDAERIRQATSSELGQLRESLDALTDRTLASLGRSDTDQPASTPSAAPRKPAEY